ncbi:sugar diacid recognition domain-containing protein [Kurthia sp. Dielmo]|uniref:CdaR family transcriptional regulator n=1 Tax=Kurthia sp. Dielmo TaxID=1033738 RepID=UPI00111DB90B|nr:sugar diacid recognition domain-containing protein [Kurthia sp. Dielmo]
MISKQLAIHIVEQTMNRLHRNINVMHTDGFILASGDKLRIDHIHEGAKYVAQTGEVLRITAENEHCFAYAKEGINLPIFYNEEVVCVVGITGIVEELEEIATLVQLTTEMMVHQAFLTEQSAWHEKMHQVTLEQLLSGQVEDAQLLKRFDKLHIQKKAPYVVVKMSTIQKQLAYQTFIHFLDDVLPDNVVYGALEKEVYVCIMVGYNKEAVMHILRQIQPILSRYFQLRIGIGQEVEQIEELRYAADTASIALQYGDPATIFNVFDDVEIYSLFKAPQSKEMLRYTQNTIGMLSQKFLETIEAFLANDLQLIKTAEALQIHRHTLSYRLEKIKEQTGLDPTVFRDALYFQIALWFRA